MRESLGGSAVANVTTVTVPERRERDEEWNAEIDPLKHRHVVGPISLRSRIISPHLGSSQLSTAGACRLLSYMYGYGSRRYEGPTAGTSMRLAEARTSEFSSFDDVPPGTKE